MSSVPRLRVRTVQIDPVDDLLAYADPARPLAWLRRGDGIVAVAGERAFEMRVAHADAAASGTRAAHLAAAWREVSAAAVVDDEVRLPGTGLIAFGALTFAEQSTADAVLSVPSLLLGRAHGRSWLTRVWADGASEPVADPTPVGYGPHWSGSLGPGSLTASGYVDAVRAGLDAIRAGEVEKVVLARDLSGHLPDDADLRRLVRELSSEYPDTWTFAVDGLIGASPETLITVATGTVTARVLAGTTPRGADADADVAASLALATSTKDLDEHEYAVQSVLRTLRPHVRAVAASEQPFTLKLPNVWHLATDVEADLDSGESSLDLVGALHPTAAVAGTPTSSANRVISRIEPFDRGRYAGPVGWIDGTGDGEWAIALRCAQFDPPTDGTIPLTAYAGAGIVAGSDPEAEMLETRVKFRPLVDALA